MSVGSVKRAQVITVSTRGAAGERDDRSGEVICNALGDLEFDVQPTIIIPDGERVATEIIRAVDAGCDLVITTGGTGISPTDQTPEYTLRVLDREIPGIAEAIRANGVSKGIPTAALSRGLAGQRGSSLVVNVPGSPGGARDAMAVLSEIVHHAIDQMRGSDH